MLGLHGEAAKTLGPLLAVKLQTSTLLRRPSRPSRLKVLKDYKPKSRCFTLAASRRTVRLSTRPWQHLHQRSGHKYSNQTDAANAMQRSQTMRSLPKDRPRARKSSELRGFATGAAPQLSPEEGRLFNPLRITSRCPPYHANSGNLPQIQGPHLRTFLATCMT